MSKKANEAVIDEAGEQEAVVVERQPHKKIETHSIFLKDILLNQPEPGEKGVPVVLITTAGTCIDIYTTCRLPASYRLWNTKGLTYWVLAPLDYDELSAVLLLEKLMDNYPFSDDETDLHTEVYPLLFPGPKEIKRTSAELYGHVVPYPDAWLHLFKIRLKKKTSNISKYKAVANMVAPLVIIAFFMLMMAMAALDG